MTTLRQLSELLDHEPVPVELGPPIFTAQPGSAHSTVPAWQAFRQRRGQRSGDFTLAVYRRPRPAQGPDFLDFAAALCREAARRAGEPAEGPLDEAFLSRAYWPGVWGPDPHRMNGIPDGPCGALLWATARQWDLTWSWGQLTAEAGEHYMPPPPGRPGHGSGWVCTQVRVDLPWDTCAATVPALRAEAHRRLAALRAPLRGLSRPRFAAAIDADLDAVARLCGPEGLVASCLVPDAEEPVEQLLVVANDGNTCELCWETSAGWHGVLYETS